jgi:hypothetical protein
MMMSQFRRRTGAFGVGFILGGKGESVYGKVGEFSGLNLSEKPSTTPKLFKITPPKPTEPIVKDGVFEEPLKAQPKNKFGFQNLIISRTYLTLYQTSMRIPFLKPKSHQE